MNERMLWEKSDEVSSGMRLRVTAGAFSVGGSPRGAVTVTVFVPDEFWHELEGGGVAATLLIDPEEALGLREWLRQAADAAAAYGKGLYDSR